MADDSKARFEEAAAFVKTWVPSKSVSNDDKLKAYALYKQATVGDVNIARPGGFLNFESNAKWDAWNAVKGKSQEEAMAAYVAEIAAQKAKYS